MLTFVCCLIKGHHCSSVNIFSLISLFTFTQPVRLQENVTTLNSSVEISNINDNYGPQTYFAKVMFLHLSVILLTGGGVRGWGTCVAGGIMHGEGGVRDKRGMCGKGGFAWRRGCAW